MFLIHAVFHIPMAQAAKKGECLTTDVFGIEPEDDEDDEQQSVSGPPAACMKRLWGYYPEILQHGVVCNFSLI